ncbi:restriction endonuclease subunit S [Planktomarina temperata]|nr:restriction endonuclease subunit S [Planktomarina temperata]
MKIPKIPFTDVLADKTAGNPKTLQSEYHNKGRFPIVDQGKGLIGGYTNDPSRLCKEPLPLIIFGDHTKEIKYIDFPFCVGADGTKILKAKIDSDLRYLFHAIKQISIPEAGYSRHFKFLKRGSIPLPPLAEQKRIAGILDAAEDLRQKRQRSLELLDELKQSIFVDMFGDPFSNPKGFPTKPISEFGQVFTGNTPSRNVEENYGSHLEWIKSDNILNNKIFVSCAKEYLSKNGASIGRKVPAGAILVTCIAGSRNSIGNVAMTNREVAFNQQINALVPSNSEETIFLYNQLFLNKELVREKSSGGMKGLVNKSNFSDILLLDPPYDLKSKFNSKFKQLNFVCQKHQKSSEYLNELFTSLQHKAFAGELLGTAA